MAASRDPWLPPAKNRYAEKPVKLNELPLSYPPTGHNEPRGSVPGLKRSSGYDPLLEDSYDKRRRLEDNSSYSASRYDERFSRYSPVPPTDDYNRSGRSGRNDNIRLDEYSRLDYYRSSSSSNLDPILEKNSHPKLIDSYTRGIGPDRNYISPRSTEEFRRVNYSQEKDLGPERYERFPRDVGRDNINRDREREKYIHDNYPDSKLDRDPYLSREAPQRTLSRNAEDISYSGVSKYDLPLGGEYKRRDDYDRRKSYEKPDPIRNSAYGEPIPKISGDIPPRSSKPVFEADFSKGKDLPPGHLGDGKRADDYIRSKNINEPFDSNLSKPEGFLRDYDKPKSYIESADNYRKTAYPVENKKNEKDTLPRKIDPIPPPPLFPHMKENFDTPNFPVLQPLANIKKEEDGWQKKIPEPDIYKGSGRGGYVKPGDYRRDSKDDYFRQKNFGGPGDNYQRDLGASLDTPRNLPECVDRLPPRNDYDVPKNYVEAEKYRISGRDDYQELKSHDSPRGFVGPDNYRHLERDDFGRPKGFNRPEVFDRPSDVPGAGYKKSTTHSRPGNDEILVADDYNKPRSRAGSPRRDNFDRLHGYSGLDNRMCDARERDLLRDYLRHDDYRISGWGDYDREHFRERLALETNRISGWDDYDRERFRERLALETNRNSSWDDYDRERFRERLALETNRNSGWDDYDRERFYERLALETNRNPGWDDYDRERFRERLALETNINSGWDDYDRERFRERLALETNINSGWDDYNRENFHEMVAVDSNRSGYPRYEDDFANISQTLVEGSLSHPLSDQFRRDDNSMYPNFSYQREGRGGFHSGFDSRRGRKPLKNFQQGNKQNKTDTKDFRTLEQIKREGAGNVNIKIEPKDEVTPDKNQFSSTKKGDGKINSTSDKSSRESSQKADDKKSISLQDNEPLTLEKVRGVMGPCGVAMVVLIKLNENPLRTIEKTQAVMKKQYMFKNEYDPASKKWIGRIVIHGNEIASESAFVKETARKATFLKAVQTLQKHYYTVLTKSDYYGGGKELDVYGNIIPAVKRLGATCHKYRHVPVPDMEKIKKAIDEYCNSDTVYDLVLSSEFDPAAQREIQKYAGAKWKLQVRKFGPQNWRFVVLSKRINIWNIVQGLIDKDVRFLNNYQLLPPGSTL